MSRSDGTHSESSRCGNSLCPVVGGLLPLHGQDWLNTQGLCQLQQLKRAPPAESTATTKRVGQRTKTLHELHDANH